MISILSKPPTEGAVLMSAQEVHELRASGAQFRLVDAPGVSDFRVRPHKRNWPLIIGTAEMKERVRAEPLQHFYMVEVENKPDCLWPFSPDQKLLVLRDS